MSLLDRQARWLATKVEGGLGALATRAFRHPGWSLLLVGLVTLPALLSARNLKLSADLVELLPKSFRSVQDVEVLKERFGGVGYLVVVGRDAEPDALRRFADDLIPRLARLPSVRYVEHRRPVEFFADRALYYMQLADLETMEQRIAAREKWEKQRRNPLYVDLEDTPPPSLDFTDIERKYEGTGGADWIRKQAGEPYYLDAQQRMIVLLIKPASIASDLAFSRRIVGEVEAALQDFDLAAYGPGLKVELTGRYKKRLDQQALIMHDLMLASLLASLLIVLYVAYYFRRVAAMGLVITPLALGTLWTFGFAGLAFDTLNILTGFIGGILTGLGVDHGIHLMSRFEIEMARARTPEQAVLRTFSSTGRGIAGAAMTTLFAFGSLSISEFRAFREFGIVAALGMFLLMLAYTGVLPALLGVALRLGWRPRRLTERPWTGYSRELLRRAPLYFWLCMLALLCTLPRLTGARFDYDFSALESNHLRSFLLDQEVNRLLGYSQTPVVVLTAAEEEERAVTEALRQRQQARGPQTTIDFIAASTDLVPQQQEEKQQVLLRIRRIIDRVSPDWLEPELREKLVRLQRMTTTQPFGRHDLPLEVRRQFMGQDGTKDEGFVLVFPAISLDDGVRVREFVHELRSVRLPDGREVAAAGEAMVQADIIEMVSREAGPVMVATGVAVLVVMTIILGSLRSALAALSPALLGLLATMGLMSLTGLRFNYLNIVAVPILFGIGVDGGIHVISRLGGGEELPSFLGGLSRAIFGSLTTTGFSFAALLLADHPGLNSVGKTALIGIAVNLVATVVALPAYLALRARSRALRAAASAAAQDHAGDPPATG